MNAPTLNDLRNALPARDFADDKMVQIRDLLIGDFITDTHARMMALEARLRDLETLETRVRDLETSVQQRLSTLAQRLDTVSNEHVQDRTVAFDELSKCVLDLSDKIRSIRR